jgi:hypothetical protein
MSAKMTAAVAPRPTTGSQTGAPPALCRAEGFVDLPREAGFHDGLITGLFTSLVVVAVAPLRRFRSPVRLAGIAGYVLAPLGSRSALGASDNPVDGIGVLARDGPLARFLSTNPLVRSVQPWSVTR